MKLCQWCGKPATHKDWREIEGTTTSTRECDSCANLKTEFLLEREAEQKGQKLKDEHEHDAEDCELSDCTICEKTVRRCELDDNLQCPDCKLSKNKQPTRC